MPAVGDTYHLRPGESVTIRSLTPDRLEMEAVWTGDGSRPPRHLHPAQSERFEVLDGELTVQLDRAPAVVVGAGGHFEVPAGTVHRMWSSGLTGARALWRVEPALRSAEMFAALDGGIDPLRAARVLWRFRREFRLATSLRG